MHLTQWLRPTPRKLWFLASVCLLLIASLHFVSWSHVVSPSACRSVFHGAVFGRWVPKANVSERSRLEVDQYLQRARIQNSIPASLQRADDRCGNKVTYENIIQYKPMWMHALCNPAGPTPCCNGSQCVNMSMEDCTCPSCLDPRVPVHAELSDWVPDDSACAVRELNTSEACALLNGTTIVIAGDSLVRQVFVAMVLQLTGNLQNGSMKENTPAGTLKLCQGMLQINWGECRKYLDENRSLCNNSVKVAYLEIFPAAKGSFLLPHVQRLTLQGQRVLLVTGLGIHDDYLVNTVWPTFLKPLVEYFSGGTESGARLATPLDIKEFDDPGIIIFNGNNSTAAPSSSSSSSSPTSSSSSVKLAAARGLWPKLVWANAHAPGLLKPPQFPRQSFQGVKYFNKAIARLLEPHGIPILDSFNLTAPVHAVDGTHYGFGVNMLKVQLLLNWVIERQQRGEWY